MSQMRYPVLYSRISIASPGVDPGRRAYETRLAAVPPAKNLMVRAHRIERWTSQL